MARASISAGLLLYRTGTAGRVEMLIVHPGGPFWAKKDAGAWSIPKGERDGDEDLLAVAERELTEELGCPVPTGPRIDLGEVRQRGGKRVRAWAVAGDVDVDAITSNTFEIEWPPRSGRRTTFPEVDRAAWVPPAVARTKLVSAQAALVDRLLASIDPPPGPGS